MAADLSGRIDLIIDGGPAPVGVESTIVACLGEPTLLRPGGLPRDGDRARARQDAGQRARTAADDEAPLAPGMLASHYAPRTRAPASCRPPSSRRSFARVRRLRCRGAAHSKKTLNLSDRGDLIEAAANLFSHLRALDAAGARAIAVMPVPHEGLGEAINDRLARAAADR